MIIFARLILPITFKISFVRHYGSKCILQKIKVSDLKDH